MEARILIAHASAVILENGKRTWIVKGRTTAREGHPILEGREHMFRPLVVDFELGADDEHETPVEHENEHDGEQAGPESQDSSPADPETAEPETAEPETAGADDTAGEQVTPESPVNLAGRKPSASRRPATRSRS